MAAALFSAFCCFFNLCVPVYSTDVYTEGHETWHWGAGGGVETRGGPQRPPVNPLGVDLLRDADELYRRMACIVKCRRTLFLFLFCVAKFLFFQSSISSSLTGSGNIFNPYLFSFLGIVGGLGGRRVVGFRFIHN